MSNWADQCPEEYARWDHQVGHLKRRSSEFATEDGRQRYLEEWTRLETIQEQPEQLVNDDTR